MSTETAFPQLCTMDKFSNRNSLPLISKINMLGWNNKMVVCSAACLISDLFSKEEPILGPAYTLPNMGSPLPNK